MIAKQDLGGDWTVRREATTGRVRAATDCRDCTTAAPARLPRRIPAQVPGCVHLDLLRAGLIPDPFVGEQENEVQWVGHEDWTYEREFVLEKELSAAPRLALVFEGLDTLATVRVNGREVGAADNMFRPWEFDVTGAVRKGRNKLEVCFRSPIHYCDERDRPRPMIQWNMDPRRPVAAPWLRKEPCNFGWDWGPVCITSGIWKPVRIEARGVARITEVQVRQQHRETGEVALDIRVESENADGGGIAARVTVRHEGGIVGSVGAPVRGPVTSARVLIEQPRLWYPNGLGGQPLYEVVVELHDGAAPGLPLDRATRRIGLRTIRLVQRADAWGESFHFVVNRQPFFAKGANWIPAHTFAPASTPDDYERLLRDAARANMNMLRAWGGGIYEHDRFYDLCDELGICVWQDFMFACSTYPTFDAAWMSGVRAEAEAVVRRLRHHPCLALWCGNNELEQGLVADEWGPTAMSWKDYDRLFHGLLREVTSALDPDADYVPSSPHKPGEPRAEFNNPTKGDAHLWAVWHGRQPFEWYRGQEHRFVSEFGFQSFPEPATLRAFAKPGDMNISSPVMEHHQRSPIGNSAILQQMMSWFRVPDTFEDFAWLSQILQGLAIKYAVEHWRRLKPRTMGALYWQHNDCWPGASWSSIDFFGRWKALHHFARRFFHPVLVSFVERPADAAAEVWLTNDLPVGVGAELVLRATDVAGKVHSTRRIRFALEPQENRREVQWDLRKAVADLGARNLLLWADVVDEGAIVSRNISSLVRPKQMEIPKAKLSWKLVAARGKSPVCVAVKSRAASMYTWIEHPDPRLRTSDSFFALLPGETKHVYLEWATGGKPVVPRDVEKSLRVRGLADLYS